MTTRRPISSQPSTPLPNLDAPSSLSSLANAKEEKKSNTAPAVPAAVIYKLLFFTAAMVGGPIGTYYVCLHTIAGGSSTFAGAMAAIMANVVLVAYVIVAMREDQSERLAEEEKVRKGE
ncbi:vacuolar ATPase assembly integral membrane protein vma21 [Trapelia coarctata]|nr:vacuolar ATPase assembly integral membrane protein vma21 [Trapelia coarctata]